VSTNRIFAAQGPFTIAVLTISSLPCPNGTAHSPRQAQHDTKPVLQFFAMKIIVLALLPMDPSGLESTSRRLESSLDHWGWWILGSTFVVVLGLVIEYWEPITEFIDEWRRPAAAFPWKKFVELTGGILVTIGVAGELGFTYKASRTETKLRENNHQIEESLNASTQTAASAANRAEASANEAKQKTDAVAKQGDALTSRMENTARKLGDVTKEAGLQLLILEMNAGDSQAYDSLVDFKNSDPSKVQSVKSAVRAAGDFFWNRARSPHLAREPAMSTNNDLLLASPDFYDRAMGLERLRTEPMQSRFVPKIVRMATSDPHLEVRGAATLTLNVWLPQKWRSLNKQNIQRWWDLDGKKQFPDR
jgi:hypothetical protein